MITVPKKIISTPITILEILTTPFAGQKAGTSGLRKQVK
jgi:hypothetical protein